MARYDYRIKRRLFRQSDIARHQNFGELEKRYARRKRTNLVRNILILIGLVLLVLIIIATAHADQKKGEYVPKGDYRELSIRVEKEIQ